MTLDEWFPFRGPCGFCGGPDARHRLFDAIAERHAAGDGVEALAEDYDKPPEAIRAVLENWTPTPDEEV